MTTLPLEGRRVARSPAARLLAAACALVLLAGWDAAAQDRRAEDLALIRSAPASTPGADALVLYDRTEVDVDEDGSVLFRCRRLVLIGSDEGARDHSVLAFEYDPRCCEFAIEECAVYRAGGGVEPLDPASAVEVPAPAGPHCRCGRRVEIAVPALRAGDAVAVQTTTRGSPGLAMPGRFSDVVVFADRYPMLEKSYALRLPAGAELRHLEANGLHGAARGAAGGRDTYTWIVHDAEAQPAEALGAAPGDYAAKLVVTNVPSWAELSRWFYWANESLLEQSDELRRRAAAVTEGLTYGEAKIAALTRWVAGRIRSLSLEARSGEDCRPHPANLVLERLAGDCEDSAALLAALLRAEGFDAYLAMASVGARVENLPANQFNRYVVAVRRPDGSYALLDPAGVAGSSQLLSAAAAGCAVLIGTPEGEDLAFAPRGSPRENTLAVSADCALDTGGELRGELEITASGRPETLLRRRLAGQRRQMILSLLAAAAPGAELQSLETVDPLDPSRPLRLVCRFRVPSFAAAQPGLLLVPTLLTADILDEVGLGGFHAATAPERRRSPIRFDSTLGVELSETIRLPVGSRTAGEGLRREASSEVSSLAARLQPEMTSVLRSLSFELRETTVPLRDYQAFRVVVGALRSWRADALAVRAP